MTGLAIALSTPIYGVACPDFREFFENSTGLIELNSKNDVFVVFRC
jgi:hypothetical protein